MRVNMCTLHCTCVRLCNGRLQSTEFPSDNMATVPQKMWAFNVVVYQEVPIRVGEKD